MHMYFLHMHESACRSQKNMVASLELELQVVVSFATPKGLGTRLRSLEKVACTLNYLAMSLPLENTF